MSGTALNKRFLTYIKRLPNHSILVFTQNKNWEKVLGTNANTRKNKARILAGMAVHMAMDSYAHKAYINLGTEKNPEWVRITNKNPKIEALGFLNAQDSKKCYSARWTCAKSIACNILQIWPDGGEASLWEFYQPYEHPERSSTEGFCMEKFGRYAQKADADNYKYLGDWFESRTP